MKLKYGKILYDTDDGAAVWKYLLGKVAALVAIGAGLFHFPENPVGISIYIAPLLFLLVFFRYEMIIVFKDRCIYIPGFSSPFKPYKEFHFQDIKTVVSPVNYDVQEHSKKERLLNLVDPRKKVHLFFNNGTDELLSTTINWAYLQQAAKTINNEIEQSYVPMRSR